MKGSIGHGTWGHLQHRFRDAQIASSQPIVVGLLADELDFTLDFDRDLERQLRHPDGTAAVRADVGAEHFAYPKALPGKPAVEQQIRTMFRSAAVAGTRANRYGRTDPWRLARSPVQRADGMHFFEQKLNGGLRLEDDVRRLVNRVRYLGAST